MELAAALKALILGTLEGFTEYLPVSSTGHLLLAEHILGLGFHDDKFDKTFAVLIQLGSILALLLVYFRRLLTIFIALPTSPQARNFTLGVLIAFLPAAVIGAVLHGFIKDVLFNPLIVCVALIVGGFILLVVDVLPLRQRYDDATAFPLSMYFKIGLLQCLAMIPGVSRSGATIVGAMALGADKRAAAEFSFFLAMPTMAGAFAYDLFKNYKTLDTSDAGLIAIGFAAAFVSGLFVVKGLLTFVSRHGFATFAWWRILVGSAGLAALWVWG
ncbi:undecaprenyl-diphosphate phosphatase [Alsobacter sp. SYSU M60028]|uniref:Undecaprenyl-diphosphatase n=1 Tax=Alsobacter ponti TaxID=2962936 RepID=A0ABT1LBD8_9HYPH|nr:undecaprenyl-diphosphate phosphatase [Alsobacter ponti]MCP8938075.1 undecaprenyl-diphosphate phosphatase [Alsobacter ponti]